MGVPQEWLNYAPKPIPLSGGDQWHVFLSYRSVNRAWVTNLYDVLQELGHNVFLDQTALKPGDPLLLKLQQALRKSASGVLVWSKTTEDSEWVSREYQILERLATEKAGFQFVPVILDGSKPPDIVGNRIHLDFKNYPDGPNGGELLRLLYAIAGQPLRPEAARFAVEQDEAAQQMAHRISAAISNGNEKRLRELFDEGGLPWRTSASLGCKVAEGLTKLSHNDEAINLLSQLETQFPKAVRPRQLHALALARRAERTGSVDDLNAAQDILAALEASGERDPETLGIYARTWFDRFERDQDELKLRRSRDLYAAAFRGAQDDFYTGINAAAKSVFLGGPEELEKADDYAARVLGITGEDLCPSDYWGNATIAEAFLIRKNYHKAAEIYQQAVTMSLTEIGSHGSTWKQARRLMDKLGATQEERAPVEKVFAHIPKNN